MGLIWVHALSHIIMRVHLNVGPYSIDIFFFFFGCCNGMLVSWKNLTTNFNFWVGFCWYCCYRVGFCCYCCYLLFAIYDCAILFFVYICILWPFLFDYLQCVYKFAGAIKTSGQWPVSNVMTRQEVVTDTLAIVLQLNPLFLLICFLTQSQYRYHHGVASLGNALPRYCVICDLRTLCSLLTYIFSTYFVLNLFWIYLLDIFWTY